MIRCGSTLFAVVVSTGFCLVTGASAQILAAKAVLEFQAKAAPQKNPIPGSAESIKAGGAVYAKICRACHGPQGKGDGTATPPGSKPLNLVDAEWKYGSSDAEIFKTIKEGVKPYDVMESWGRKISDKDIWNTVNYLRDLAKRAKATRAKATP